MRLKGKVAIVTGASRGLGRAMAIGFSKEGANVAVAARTEVDKKRTPWHDLSNSRRDKALGVEALAIRCDVTDEESVRAMVDAVFSRFGRIEMCDFPCSSGCLSRHGNRGD